jgi:hypothetical protein
MGALFEILPLSFRFCCRHFPLGWQSKKIKNLLYSTYILALANHLYDRNINVRLKIIQALGEIRSEIAIPQLASTLTDLKWDENG